MNYAYQTLATNMRGFNQNARNGNNFVVINSELRFPVFRYFYNRPIKSDFLTNFQLVTFGDVGLAWAGEDPFSDENSFYIRYIQDGSLWIKIREQKEPLIGGFGFGARTRLLGYFLRADVAWGVEDRDIHEAVFYLSLSLDF
jgi:outer membrane translocation and assembly module TamA